MIERIKRVVQAGWQTIIRIFAFISKEIRIILHQPRLVFSLILGPFFILLLFGVGYSNVPRSLKTLFVVPEGSQMEGYVEQYAGSLGDRIAFAGITHDADEADGLLRRQEVDLVVVTPLDPALDWENDKQSTFSLYHYEIDPIEDVYIQVMGRRYVEEINRHVLTTAVSQSQQEAHTWHEDVAQVKAHAAAVKEAIAAGDQVRAQQSAESLQQDVNLLTLALGGGVAMVAGLEEANGQPGTTSDLLTRLEALQGQTDELAAATTAADTSAIDTFFSEGTAKVAEVEASLTEVDELLLKFQDMETAVLVAPFRSETLSVTQVRLEPMFFYVPAVIALLLQHLSVTLAGLSIIREKLSGAMELFRAAPVTAFEMLIGKYSSYLLMIGVMAAVLTALIIWGLRVPQLGLWANYILVIVALLLASLGLGFNISLSARSDSQAVQYGMLTLLAAIFFSGFFLPLYRLVPAVRTVSWLLPATYGTILLQDVMLRGQWPSPLLLGALFGFAAILFLLGWFRLGRQMVKE
jgi:ABC-2 type transport system permease protein